MKNENYSTNEAETSICKNSNMRFYPKTYSNCKVKCQKKERKRRGEGKKTIKEQEGNRNIYVIPMYGKDFLSKIPKTEKID